MKPSSSLNSACRHCRFYLHEGRRGGHCQQLDVPVQSSWKACSLSLPPFAPSWETIEQTPFWPEEVFALQVQMQELIHSVQSDSYRNHEEVNTVRSSTPSPLV